MTYSYSSRKNVTEMAKRSYMAKNFSSGYLSGEKFFLVEKNIWLH